MRCAVSAWFALVVVAAFCGGRAYGGGAEPVDLGGTWRFRLDPDNAGLEDGWFRETLPDSVSLPGSLNENGIGDEISPDTPWTGTLTSRMWHDDERFARYREPGNTKILFWLQADRHYIGPAWYQRAVEVPESFAGKHVTLYLERCHWETRLWIDGEPVGARDSLSVPHEYDVTALATPGPHTLTLRIDNTYGIDVGVNAHSVSDNTQTNWNGVVGAMRLCARDLVHITDVQAYPDVAGKRVRIVADIANHTGLPAAGTLTLRAESTDGAGSAPPLEMPVSVPGAGGQPETHYPMGDAVRLWSEFDPALYTLVVELHIGQGGRAFADEYRTVFGMREMGVDGTQFTLNGERIFLRGTLECAIFPLTGYPPTDVAAWRKVLTAARAHGLNHMRFHSWCPPEAAFEAGDEMGFLFHVEGPFWTHPGEGGPLDAYIYEECDRILRAYGNHPSFAFLAYGNEPGGRKHEAFLGELVDYWKAKDGRRLYTAAAGWPKIEASQYHVAHEPRVHSNYGGKGMRFSVEPFSTTMDYRDYVAQWDVPVVSHEIGQWCVFPNLDEIGKYTGPLKPRNFEIVRDMLAEQGMLDLARDFLLASGRLQTLCYKEEIEAALRTPGFGGFQLLDLHDFPGQGTALVGVLDPFWESKGYVTAEEFRRFCGPTVPLMRMDTCVFGGNGAFHGRAEVTHFGPEPLNGVTPTWRLKSTEGVVVREGSLTKTDIPRASAIVLGEVVFDFAGLPAPAQYKLELAVCAHANDWDLWVYPEAPPAALPESVHVADVLDQAAIRTLEAGGSVLLLPGRGAVARPRFGPVPPGFPPIFWNTFWFPAQRLRTLGILCDPAHPLFAAFPTEFHSNWQWWDLVTRAQVMSLDGLPKSVRPLVQVIDDWNTCRRLGLVFEARVGNGRLLACSMDIENGLEDRHAARQFRASLFQYMASGSFNPSEEVSYDALRTVFREPTLLAAAGATAVADSQQTGFEAGNAIDGDPGTIWHTRWSERIDPYPHWIRIDLEQTVTVTGLAVLPRQDMTNGRLGGYRVYVGDDPREMGRAVARGDFEPGDAEQVIRFDEPKRGRHILLRAVRPQHEEHPWASVAEIRLLGEESMD